MSPCIHIWMISVFILALEQIMFNSRQVVHSKRHKRNGVRTQIEITIKLNIIKKLKYLLYLSVFCAVFKGDPVVHRGLLDLL